MKNKLWFGLILLCIFAFSVYATDSKDPSLGSVLIPGISCKHIKDVTGGQDGIYWIDPDGLGRNKPVKVYCDMTTNGGGWTAIMNPVNNELPDFSLDAKININIDGTHCVREIIAETGGFWSYAKSYVCWWESSYVQLDWKNILNADEVLLRATSLGDNNFITLNEKDIINNRNNKNSFALTGESCDINNCWDNDTFRDKAIPIKEKFSGDLKIKAGGKGDGSKWGGSGSIWGVLVRESTIYSPKYWERLSKDTISSTESRFEELKKKEINVEEITELLSSAKEAFELKYYGTAFELAQDASSRIDEIIKILEIIKNAEDVVKETEELGCDVKIAKEKVRDAQVSIKKGYFESAKADVNEAVSLAKKSFCGKINIKKLNEFSKKFSGRSVEVSGKVQSKYNNRLNLDDGTGIISVEYKEDAGIFKKHDEIIVKGIFSKGKISAEEIEKLSFFKIIKKDSIILLFTILITLAIIILISKYKNKKRRKIK